MTPEEFATAPLSAVIRTALDDLAKVEADQRYVVDMGIWHAPDPADSRCHVCLAGAVLAGTLGVEPGVDVYPGHEKFGRVSFSAGAGERSAPVPARLLALNDVREGYLELALYLLGVDVALDLLGVDAALDRTGPGIVRITPYHDDPAAFRRDLLAVADALEKEGL